MSAISWEKIINNPIQLEVQTQVTPTKGNLVYEYNPFRNYRLTTNMYEYKESLYSLKELASLFDVYLGNDKQTWYKKDAESTRLYTMYDGSTVYATAMSLNLPILHEKGELVDFITDELSFDLNHPVNIVPQYSYDGSVNLILNDGVNPPRLINSRFSATGRNTYEVVDRKGNNDTNIYDLGEAFKIDTSLYKSVINIPNIHFYGCTAGGNLKVGNYFFYFKLADADGNETDFIGESGLVSVFIGFDNPSSITTGLKNENSFKNVKFIVDNIDVSYDYVYVYYSRTTAEGADNAIPEYIKIEKKYPVNNAGICDILVTGHEPTVEITSADINLNYNIVDSAKALATCQNYLFLGNVHKTEIPYEELADLSLRFLPYLKEEQYPLEMDLDYNISSTELGYYDEKYIYYKTGYWENELYRLGIVYILPNGELSPVFNIRGGIGILQFNDKFKLKIGTEALKYLDGQFLYYPVYTTDPVTGLKLRYKIKYNETTNFLFDYDGNEVTRTIDGSETNYKSTIQYENNKGVVRFIANTDTNTVHGWQIRVDPEVITELKKYVKGYFFVRQKRIPTIIALGITMGIDKESHTPVIATADGVLNELSENLEKTHVTTEDINNVNYISEGFLRRYSFHFKLKSSHLWNKILKAVGVVVAVAAIAVAAVYTGGAALGALGVVTAAGSAVTGASAVAATFAGLATALSVSTTVAAGIAIAGAGALTAIGMATAGAIQEIRYACSSAFSVKKLDGRNTLVPSGYKLEEDEESRQLNGDFNDRIIIKDPSTANVLAILCPDFELNQALYNQIFTGNKHLIQLTRSLSTNGLSGHSSNYFSNDYRHFYIPSYYDMDLYNSYTFKVIGVPDDAPIIGIDECKFRSRAGNAEEPWRYECIGEDYKSDFSKKNKNEEDEETLSNKKINSDIVRGSFGPYLAFDDENNKFSPAETVNIYIPKYSESNIKNYITIRMNDSSVFSAISERIDILNLDSYLISEKSNIVGDTTYLKSGYKHEAYRGDCFLCQYTHRLNRNFNAPSSPYNDDFVDVDTWRDHYNPEEPTSFADLNLGDVNAVQLGMWVTFRIRSASNLNIRTLDGSDVTESTMTGSPRGYYPYHPMSTEGAYKKPEAQVFNKGFNNKLSERWNFEMPDVPYIKNWFGTRIMYSDLHTNDAYKNGYRVFRGTNFRDYTREYGEIVKLVSLNSNLLCVFEHGVALIPVNERTIAGTGAGGNVYINTKNVLPENPKVISDMYGSQWADSVLKVPGKTGSSIQWVYGVDTVAKKIWKTDGTNLVCISDLKVLEFLNNNITLGERELTPILGVRNVKTCYNAYKQDVMFTFYDNTYGFEEKVWNLCWNERLEKFITFYSWVPSFMENINNVPFSFDRNVSKWIAKLGTSHADNSFADGVTLTNNVINNYFSEGESESELVSNFKAKIKVQLINGLFAEDTYTVEDTENFIGVLGLSNRMLPDDSVFYTVSYTLERDPWGNNQLFEIKYIGDYTIKSDTYAIPEGYFKAKYPGLKIPIYGLYMKLNLDSEKQWLPIYTEPETLNIIYTSPTKAEGTEVCTKAMVVSAETLMSELYYRNVAGHYYADNDTNKTKYRIKNEVRGGGSDLDPDEIYDINEVIAYVISKGNFDTSILPEVCADWVGQDVETVFGYMDELTGGKGNDNSKPENKQTVLQIARCLLSTNGGPFTDESKVYLGTKSTPYACGGGLKTLIEHPEWHAPFSQHFMFGADIEEIVFSRKQIEELPPFKDLSGKRLMLPKEERVREDLIVTLLAIKANVLILDEVNEQSLSDSYYNMKASYIDAAQYESIVGVTTKWNLQFLTSDFWKHGQAGIIDIADDIFPTYWYGKQHPFEFEFIVVNDPSVHKIFTNLEIIANKAKPESFHYEVIGEAYDFAKDKVNMYFRQEAIKALWQYNGLDITYNRNFLKLLPKQNPKSADLLRTYFARKQSINDVEDYYYSASGTTADYSHLSGGEIVYYPNRLEFRIWNHVKAVDVDDQLDTSATSFGGRGLIASNMRYLEDRWKVTINPLLVVYRNEYSNGLRNSTWASSYTDPNYLLPPLPIYNSPIPDAIKLAGKIEFPGVPNNEDDVDESHYGLTNALYHLYDMSMFGKLNRNGTYSFTPLDTQNWLNINKTYRTDFGEALNRKETDIRDKFVKVRIRYSGEDLAVIDWINTIYQISYA